MSPTLTRRDAIAALGAAGVVLGGGAIALDALEEEGLTERDVATVVAVAEVVYPTDVEGIAPFVERFLAGRAADRPAHASGVREAARRLDEYAQTYHGARFVELSRSDRVALMRSMGLDEADPDPEGADPFRLRYYLVNEVLFALYSTPTGASLVGLENPQGYPGGTTSYQRPPDRDR